MTVEKDNLFFSVVVVSSRATPEKTTRCLSSLFQNAYPANAFEVIVVDSGSGTAVLDYLRQEEKNHPHLKVILPGQGNIGPARGRNLGIKAAKGAIVAFTDDDVVVATDWLEKIVDGYRRYPWIAGVGGLCLPYPEISAANVWAYYEEVLYRGLLKNKTGEYLSSLRDEHPAYGGNISYRKTVLEEVGGFNEAFTPLIYGEDGDLKERVLGRGYQLLYVPLINYHLADYNFGSFWQKGERRGVGILFYRKRRILKKPSRVVEVLKMWLFPVVLLRELVKSSDLRFSLVSTLAFWARQAGKLRYYAEV